MAGRRVLIIGSQNDALGRLSFLPRVAERLHALMTTGPGECLGVELKDRPAGLLIDPTVEETKAAIRAAVQQAAAAGESLVLGYVGHGTFSDGRFYLMPSGTVEPTPDGAVDVTRELDDRLRSNKGGQGVTVIIDACHAGEGVKEAMKSWADGVRHLRAFELLTATDDRVTAGAPLFHTLIKTLERGAPEPEAGVRLRCRDVFRRLDTEHHPAQLVEFGADLILGRNNAKDPGDVSWNWEGSPSSPDILQRTLHFQPTAALRRLVEASKADPVVLLTGPAGAGKSTLAAALARPELTEGAVPDGFVQAIAVLKAGTNENDLAVDLEIQLRRTVPDFATAVDEFRRSLPPEERKRLDYVSQKVVGPLTHLPAGVSVRVVLDGFDRLSELTRKTVADAFAKRPAALRLIITAHPEAPGFHDVVRLPLESSGDDAPDAYLKSRGVGPPARTAILAKSAGLWLATELLADAVLADPTIDLAGLPETVAGAYRQRLAQVTGGTAAAWRDRFGPVLSLLAVAGEGPVLPLPLLVHASGRLGGPSTHQEVRTTLDALGGLVVRRDARSLTDHASLFHVTMVEFLLSKTADEAGFAIDAQAAHRAIIGAINALAPLSKRLEKGPLHRYAFLREAHHLWATDKFNEVYTRLFQRMSNIPMENLLRYEEWGATFEGRFGSHGPATQLLRYQAAFWTAASGDAREALTKFDRLWLDQMGSIGPFHRATLRTRCCIASLTGELGDAPEALKRLEELLPIQEQKLGFDDPDVLATRHNIAFWKGRCGDALGALNQFGDVLLETERAPEIDYRDLIITRSNLATWVGRCGNSWEALRMFKELNIETESRLDGDDPIALKLRNNLAYWTGRRGDIRSALTLCQKLLIDQERVLGRDHPETLSTIGNIGVYMIKSGHFKVGCQRLREGLERAKTRTATNHQLVRLFERTLQRAGCCTA